jgi:hypothetical protein
MRAAAVCALENALADNALLLAHESRRVGEAWIQSGSVAYHDDLEVARASNLTQASGPAAAASLRHQCLGEGSAPDPAEVRIRRTADPPSLGFFLLET